MQTWQAIELMGFAHYADKGYRILVSLIDNSGFDFVAYKDDSFNRVCVHKAGLKDHSDPNSWSIARSGSSSDDSRPTCDTHLVWLPHQKRFIELERDFLSAVSSKSRRIPKHLL